MTSLAPFLPPHLVRSLSRSGPPARLPRVERFPSALLLSDISGFTALTERLQARGREGAEEIAATINAAFAPAITAIEKQGGSIVSFGGDALFAVFPGFSPVRRALAAAEAIRDSFARGREIATSAGAVKLGISQAVHHGDVLGLHLGTPWRRHYLVAGPAVDSLARLEARASGGKLLLSLPARRKLKHESGRAIAPGRCLRAGAATLRPYLEPRLLPLLARFEGEYRRATVLFLETKGARPAALQELYLALVDVLDRTGGVFLKTDPSAGGTKWMCAFGVPEVHEEDPDRAARAALQVLGRTPRSIAIRGGLHAGTVANIVVGTRSRRSFDLMGDVVNTAARALTQARGGEVLMTDETRRLLAGVESEARGSRTVKGKATVLELHAIKAAHVIVKRLRVSAPMVGRDAELRQIAGALERAKAGQGSAMGIRGEPGLGKSRLKYEAAMVAREIGFEVHEGRAISFGGMAYGTIGGLLREALGLPEASEKEDVLARVSAASERLGMKPTDRHHLADVLGVRYPTSPIEHLQPNDVRRNAMIAIRAFCQAIASDKPRLLVLEDMHWADGASEEAAEWLARGAGEVSSVLLLLYRPGYRPPQSTIELSLGELPPASVEDLVQHLLGKAHPDVEALVKERAGGNPFYVEELVRYLLESGFLAPASGGYRLVRDPGPADLPEGIEALIAGRLDRITATAKRVAQHAAVIGRSFRMELLERLLAVSRVAAGVGELERKELVLLASPGPPVEYAFKHALTRDVAYGTLLRSRRRRIHRKVASALQRAGGGEATHALVGHHWEQAGNPARARACYLEAARLAHERHASEDHQRLLRAYLALTEAPTQESVKHQLALARSLHQVGRTTEGMTELTRLEKDAGAVGALREQTGALLGMAEIHTSAFRLDEAVRLIEEARALSDVLGDPGTEAEVLATEVLLLQARGDMERAAACLDRILTKLRGAVPPRQVVRSLESLGNLARRRGRIDEAERSYLEALELATSLDEDIQVSIQGNLATMYAALGRYDEAHGLLGRAVDFGRKIGHRVMISVFLNSQAAIHHVQGRLVEARAGYLEVRDIARAAMERGQEIVALGNLAELAQQAGDLASALHYATEALALARGSGDPQLLGMILWNAASIVRQHEGDVRRALELAEEARQLLERVDDRMELAKCLCELGHIALASGRSASVELLHATALIREMGADAASEVAVRRDALERASAAFDSGLALVRGELPIRG